MEEQLKGSIQVGPYTCRLTVSVAGRYQVGSSQPFELDAGGAVDIYWSIAGVVVSRVSDGKLVASGPPCPPEMGVSLVYYQTEPEVKGGDIQGGSVTPAISSDQTTGSRRSTHPAP